MFPGGKGGRCVGLTTLPPSSADCLEIWDPQPSGTLRACNGIALPYYRLSAAVVSVTLLTGKVHDFIVDRVENARNTSVLNLVLDCILHIVLYWSVTCTMKGGFFFFFLCVVNGVTFFVFC
jgi:hypothetical protein